MTRDAERAYLPGGLQSGPPPAAPTPRTPAVLIVAYRNPADLRACLRSVGEHLPDLPVLVWDNSVPAEPEMASLAAEFPDVRWYSTGENLGFAAGVNRLAEAAPDHDLLLLNPDAVLRDDLARTRAALGTAGVAAAAPGVRDPDDHDGLRRPWDVAHRPRGLIRSLVSHAGYAERLRGTPLSDLYSTRPDSVSGYLTGACLAISRDAWNALGPFDEEYFLYGEESDWQTRATDAGWRLVLTEDPGVDHTGHGTVRNDRSASRRSADLLRANVALNLEHAAGPRVAGAFLVGHSALDRVQRSKRRPRTRATTPSIVITTNRLVFGGAERQHVVLASELARRGHDVTIACMQRFGPLVREIPHGVRVVRQPWWAPALELPAGPQILISGDTNTETGFATLWRAAGRNRKWLVAAHIPPALDGPTYSTGLAAAMRRADGFIALSDRHWTEATAHQDLGSRHFTAPNGVASAASLGGVPPRPAVGDPPRLAMLSRIVEHKNPHLLVEALAGLREMPWELSIYGDGPDRARLEALTPDDLRDRVHWRGWSPGPDHALAEADLLCVPSRSEAFPLVILEAMARKVPVVASSVCAVPDMLDHGRAGALVDDVSVTGWRDALAALLERPEEWAALGENGFDRMRERYTIEAMADAYEAAFAGVAP